MENLTDYKLFTFFMLDQGDIAENAQMSTAIILAKHFEEAKELCRKQFEPEGYHEIPVDTIYSLIEHFKFNKHPRPTMLANNDEIKEI